MTRIFVRGIDVYAYHGVPDAEQAVGHRYLIDIEVEANETAQVTDRAENTVDYSVLASLAVEIATARQFRTVERLASEIIDAALERFRSVESVTVRVTKPHPPMPIIAAAAGVELSRQRASGS